MSSELRTGTGRSDRSERGFALCSTPPRHICPRISHHPPARIRGSCLFRDSRIWSSQFHNDQSEIWKTNAVARLRYWIGDLFNIVYVHNPMAGLGLVFLAVIVSHLFRWKCSNNGRAVLAMPINVLATSLHEPLYFRGNISIRASANI